MSITAHPIITEVMNAFRAVPATSRIIGTKPPAKPTARRIRCGGCTHAIASIEYATIAGGRASTGPTNPAPGSAPIENAARRPASPTRARDSKVDDSAPVLFLFERSRDGGDEHAAHGQPDCKGDTGGHHQTHLPQQHQGDPRNRERDQQPTTSTLERFEDLGVSHASTVGGPGVLTEPGSSPAGRRPCVHCVPGAGLEPARSRSSGF